MNITLDQLALVVPKLQEVFQQWLEANDSIDIDSLLIGYLAAHEHEGMDYTAAKALYEKHIKSLLKDWQYEQQSEPEEEYLI